MKKILKPIAVFLPLIMLISVLTGIGITASADTGDISHIDVSLTPRDSIVTNYYVDYEKYMQQGADTLYYSYNSSCETEEYINSDHTVDLNNIGNDVKVEDGKIKISVPQAAAQISEPVSIRLYDSSDNNTVCEFNYAALDYCKKIINTDATVLAQYMQPEKIEQLKVLCKSIVEYAKSAQGVFDEYMAEDGAVAITDSYSDDISLDSASYDSDYNKSTDNIPGDNISFRTASFVCTSSAKMRFYFNVNDENDSTNYGEPIVEGIDTTCEKGFENKDGKKDYFIQINDIKPTDFNKKITVKYAGASIKMSVLDYAARVVALSQDSELKTLAKSLIVFNEKADDYYNSVVHSHTMEYVPAKAANCTESGNSAYYYCSGCSKCFTDSYGFNETTLEAVTLAALDHNYETSVTAPTCTEQGYTTYTCTRCEATYKDNYTDAKGHTPLAATHENFVAASCTQPGSYDDVVYCSVCNAELSRTHQTVNALGHDWVAGTVVAPTHEADGYTNYSCSRCEETKTGDTVPALNIKVKLENVDSYLYRIGNANSVALGKLFEVEDANKNTVDSTKVSVTATKIAGNAAATITANTSDWTSTTVKCTGTGVIEFSVKQNGTEAASLKMEVVAGSNIVGTTLSSATSNNAVLLNDVTVTTKTGVSVSNGYTLYGNGFTVTDARTSTATAAGFINIPTTGGSIDNAKLIGQEYDTQVTSGVNNEGYAPGVRTEGDFNIYNCYVSGCKNAIETHGGKGYIVNTTIDGGAISNLLIVSGNITMEDCVTTRSTRGTKSGLSIWLGSSTAAKLTINGTLKQYNLITNSEIPSDYRNYISDVYNNSTYYYTVNSKKYVNMGVMCLDTSNSIVTATAKKLITDNRASSDVNTYGYIEEGTNALKGTLYTSKASVAASLFEPPAEYETEGQYYTQPATSFDYTNKNYQENDGGNTYCYYSSATGIVNISFESGSSKEWDPMILTATKQSQTLSYTVSMNGTDYTNKKINFTEAGDYDVKYTFTDPYNYDKDGNTFSHTYEVVVNINVRVVDTGVTTYPAEFSYTGNWANNAKIVTINNENYVMPDVSATGTYISSTTVNGVTVYCPKVTVNATTSSGGSYSSGGGYFLSPAFNAINIKDYNQTTGANDYNYDSSTQNWPRSESSTAGPDSSVFGCPGVDGGTSYNGGSSPWRSNQSNSGVYSFKYVQAAGGLVFSTNNIEKDKEARSIILKFHYTSMEGKTYYYYINYDFPAFTYTQSGNCITADTLVTLADGTQKRAAELTGEEELLVWNLETGKYDSAPLLFVDDTDEEKEYNVIRLTFSDGTQTKLIYEHAYFDLDEGKYVYITEENYRDYIGDRFVKQKSIENNTYDIVTLTDSEIITEFVRPYGPVTVGHLCFFVDGMLSMPGGVAGLFNIFDVDTQTMTYDFDSMQRDIQTYGVYSLEDFDGMISQDVYDAVNAGFLKISVAKGLMTWDDIVRIATRYAPFFESGN